MPFELADGTVDQSGKSIIVRSLTREYRFRADCPKLSRALGYLAAEPEMMGMPLDPIEYHIESAPGHYRMQLRNGMKLEHARGPLANSIHQIIASGLKIELPQPLLLHAASIASGTGRVIVLGAKGAGKTTLSLRMLQEGFAVEGDEHVMVREADVVTRPRRLRIKESTLPLFPALADAIRGSPRTMDPYQGPIYSVNLAIAGTPWRIAPARPTHFVFIEPNHGGHSTLSRMHRDEAFRRLIAHATFIGESKLTAAIRLRRHLDAATPLRLSLGNIDGALRHLRHIVEEDAESG